MRYTVTRQRIEVIGKIWMPAATCAMMRDLTSYEMDQIEDPRDRDSVLERIYMLFGDFQSITDFQADFHIGDEHIEHPWSDPESEFTFSDCMFPQEDE